MRKPTYIVVSLTVLTLFTMGAFSRLLAPLIPPEESNALASDRSAFHRQAASHQLRWWPLERSSFVEARRQNRLIVLFIGLPWSKLSRTFDRYVFSDRRVVSFLNRNAICVRVDASQATPWLNVYFPLSRAPGGFVPEAQVYVLDSAGELLDVFFKVDARAPTGPLEFLEVLNRSRNRVEGSHSPEGTETAPRTVQQRDLNALANPPGAAWEDLGPAVLRVAQAVHPRHGGFPQEGIQRHWPSALRLLLMTGSLDEFQRAMDPRLRTPIVDWVRGGFFAMAVSTDWLQLEYDKPATTNADLVFVLALAHRLTDNALYRRLAQDTFAFIRDELSSEGLVSGGRIGDESGIRNRSRSVSFSPRALRDLWWHGPLEQRHISFAREALGLRVETNPSMVVQAEDPSRLTGPDYDVVMRELRRLAAKSEASYADALTLEVGGVVAARTLDAGVLLNDPEMIAYGGALFDRLGQMHTGGDVSHSLQEAAPALGDYLAYADAALSDFLATGRVVSLEAGQKVLERAEFLFAVPGAPGDYRLFLNFPGDLGPKDLADREVSDGLGESATAKIARLQTTYGLLLAGPEHGLDDARITISRLSGTILDLGFPVAAFIASATMVLDNTHAVTVGPDAVEAAAALRRLRPTRLVAPALGPVRPDIQARAPGVYVVRPGRIEGPFTVEAAAANLRRFLQTVPES